MVAPTITPGSAEPEPVPGSAVEAPEAIAAGAAAAGENAAAAAVATEVAGGGAGEAAAAATPPRRRRRRMALLFLLLGVVVVFIGVAGWYLATRKPVTVMPLPGITETPMPHYAFSVYGVSKPTGVAVTSDGNRIYATDTGGAGNIKVFDGKGTPVGTLSIPEKLAEGSDHLLVYVAVDPTNGDVYATDRPAGTIWVFSADGGFRRQFEPEAQLNGWQPLGIAFGPNNNLYVTDVSGPFHRVDVVTRDGKLVQTIGEQGQMNFPNGIAFDAQGRIYVTDSNDGRLLIFDGTGRQVAVIARGARTGELGIPRGIAIDDQGTTYVVDMTSDSVQLYAPLAAGDRSPKFLGRVGTEGNGDGSFQFPNGVAVDTRARIYVTDQVNDRVQVWSY